VVEQRGAERLTQRLIEPAHSEFDDLEVLRTRMVERLCTANGGYTRVLAAMARRPVVV
jgi:ribosomal protein L17